MSYYKNAFKTLMDNDVPGWFIRLYLIDALVDAPKVYVHWNEEYDEDDDDWAGCGGWYCCTVKLDDRECYGELIGLGFPTWEEYRDLYDGTEHDEEWAFMHAYDQHKEEWLRMERWYHNDH